MKKIYLFLILMVVGSTMAIAQNRDTRKADQHFDRLEYVKAAEEYEKLVNRGKADDYVYTRLANAYYFINDTQKAEPYFRQVADSSNDPELLYSYAQTLKANGKISESNQWMDRFAQMAPSDSRAVAYRSNPNYIPKLMEEAERHTVNMAEGLNSAHSDFGGEISGNLIYFTSSRNTSRRSHGMTQEPFYDIYVADYVNGTFGDIRPVKGDVNTKFHEGVVAISPDGNRMYFDRNDFYRGKYRKDEEGINQLNIYYAELIDGSWRDIQPVPFNNSEYSVGHPALSPDGKTLYFVSDMPGTIGDSDIFKVAIHEDGTFGTPENLGRGINTEGKEVFPFVDADGTLYFSSNGHLGLGGLDVFYAKKTATGFGEVKNMGNPVNSPADDFAIKYDVENGTGFVSSNRGGTQDNIYKIVEICSSTIESIVLNAYTGEPLNRAEVTLYDTNQNRLSTKMTDASGKVSFEVECEQNFIVQAAKTDFETNSVRANTNEREVKAEIRLRPIEEIIVEDRVVLNPILFDFDKHNIKPQAALELDKLVQIMKKYPKMIIRVEGHTDSRGSAEYNLQLSDRRVKSTIQYVISQGIDEDRISGEGFGQSRPIHDCGANCTEEQHAENRRSEFIIVNMD